VSAVGPAGRVRPARKNPTASSREIPPKKRKPWGRVRFPGKEKPRRDGAVRSEGRAPRVGPKNPRRRTPRLVGWENERVLITWIVPNPLRLIRPPEKKPRRIASVGSFSGRSVAADGFRANALQPFPRLPRLGHHPAATPLGVSGKEPRRIAPIGSEKPPPWKRPPVRHDTPRGGPAPRSGENRFPADVRTPRHRQAVRPVGCPTPRPLSPFWSPGLARKAKARGG